MGWLSGVLVAYALLNIGGGIAGYLSPKHSVPSVISGVAAGVLLLGAAALAASFPKPGYVLAAIVTVADLGFFSTRLAKGGGIWPAGVMAAASLLVLICLIAAHFGARTSS